MFSPAPFVHTCVWQANADNAVGQELQGLRASLAILYKEDSMLEFWCDRLRETHTESVTATKSQPLPAKSAGGGGGVPPANYNYVSSRDIARSLNLSDDDHTILAINTPNGSILEVPSPTPRKYQLSVSTRPAVVPAIDETEQAASDIYAMKKQLPFKPLQLVRPVSGRGSKVVLPAQQMDVYLLPRGAKRERARDSAPELLEERVVRLKPTSKLEENYVYEMTGEEGVSDLFG